MDILAGVVCGLAFATIVLGAAIWLLKRNKETYERLSGIPPRGLTPGIATLFAVLAIPPFFGVLGAIAGLLYWVASRSLPDAGLGSPNFAFTLAILCIGAVVAVGWLALRRRVDWLALTLDLAFIGLLGWVLPLLANWR
jgi:LPXTG-motif cell wall-anchored protein